MTKRMLCAAVAILAVAGCRQTAAPVDTERIEKQLKAEEAKWKKAYAEHDAEALAGIYADDAGPANRGTGPVRGTEGSRKERAAFASDPNLKVQFTSDRVQVAAPGNLAYMRGRYTMTTTDPATKKPQTSEGNYLTVWRKQADGDWRAVEDFFTPGRSAPGG